MPELMKNDPSGSSIETVKPFLIVSVASELPNIYLKYLAQYADHFEYRADLFPSQDSTYALEQMGRLRRYGGVVLTARTEDQGGKWPIADELRRMDFFQRTVDFADIVDIEITSRYLGEVVDVAHAMGKSAMASNHWINESVGTDELLAKYTKGKAAGADFVKLAANTNEPGSLDHLKIITNDHDDIISVALGENGLEHRLELIEWGSRGSYGHDGTGEVATGQPFIGDLAARISKRA